MVSEIGMSFQSILTPPEAFNYDNPDGWNSWLRRFERYRQASGLHEESKKKQVNLLLYLLGDKGDDILSSLGLSQEQQGDYDFVVRKLNDFFNVRVNVIYERALFNRLEQKVTDTVEEFNTSLFAQAQKCNYGDLKEEMIRDCIVIGIRDKSLSERLQMDNELTLAKAVNVARNTEFIKSKVTFGPFLQRV